MPDAAYMTHMLERIVGQNLAILKAVGSMQEKISMLATKAELKVVADDVAIIKSVLTATNADVIYLDRRVTRLEQAA